MHPERFHPRGGTGGWECHGVGGGLGAIDQCSDGRYRGMGRACDPHPSASTSHRPSLDLFRDSRGSRHDHLPGHGFHGRRSHAFPSRYRCDVPGSGLVAARPGRGAERLPNRRLCRWPSSLCPRTAEGSRHPKTPCPEATYRCWFSSAARSIDRPHCQPCLSGPRSGGCPATRQTGKSGQASCHSLCFSSRSPCRHTVSAALPASLANRLGAPPPSRLQRQALFKGEEPLQQGAFDGDLPAGPEQPVSTPPWRKPCFCRARPSRT